MFDLTLPFASINSIILVKFIGFKERYIEVFLSDDCHTYLIALAVLSFIEWAMVVVIAYSLLYRWYSRAKK